MSSDWLLETDYEPTAEELEKTEQWISKHIKTDLIRGVDANGGKLPDSCPFVAKLFGRENDALVFLNARA